MTEPTNWQEFNQIYATATEKLEKIVIVNKEKAYVYIKKEFLSGRAKDLGKLG